MGLLCNLLNHVISQTCYVQQEPCAVQLLTVHLELKRRQGAWLGESATSVLYKQNRNFATTADVRCRGKRGFAVALFSMLT